jgi:hypothetical protein
MQYSRSAIFPNSLRLAKKLKLPKLKKTNGALIAVLTLINGEIKFVRRTYLCAVLHLPTYWKSQSTGSIKTNHRAGPDAESTRWKADGHAFHTEYSSVIEWESGNNFFYLSFAKPGHIRHWRQLLKALLILMTETLCRSCSFLTHYATCVLLWCMCHATETSKATAHFLERPHGTSTTFSRAIAG